MAYIGRLFCRTTVGDSIAAQWFRARARKLTLVRHQVYADCVGTRAVARELAFIDVLASCDAIIFLAVAVATVPLLARANRLPVCACSVIARGASLRAFAAPVNKRALFLLAERRIARERFGVPARALVCPHKVHTDCAVAITRVCVLGTFVNVSTRIFGVRQGPGVLRFFVALLAQTVERPCQIFDGSVGTALLLRFFVLNRVLRLAALVDV